MDWNDPAARYALIESVGPARAEAAKLPDRGIV